MRAALAGDCQYPLDLIGMLRQLEGSVFEQ
jgi:hypothetical protein